MDKAVLAASQDKEQLQLTSQKIETDLREMVRQSLNQYRMFVCLRRETSTLPRCQTSTHFNQPLNPKTETPPIRRVSVKTDHRLN